MIQIIDAARGVVHDSSVHHHGHTPPIGSPKVDLFVLSLTVRVAVVNTGPRSEHISGKSGVKPVEFLSRDDTCGFSTERKCLGKIEMNYLEAVLVCKGVLDSME